MKRFTMIAVVLALTASMSWAALELRQSTAVTVKLGPFVNATDGVTPETALTIHSAHVRLSKNGGNMAAKNDANSCSHDEIGVYDCALDTTDTNTRGRLDVYVNDANCAYGTWAHYMVIDPNIWDSRYVTGEIPGIAHLINRIELTLPQMEDGSDPNSGYLAAIDDVNDAMDERIPDTLINLVVDANGAVDANLVLWDGNDPGELATKSDMETAAQTGAEAAITTYSLDAVPTTLGTAADTDLATDIANVASAIAAVASAVSDVNTAVGAIASNTVADGTVAEGGTASTFTLSSGFVATDNAYPVGSLLMFTDAGSGKKYCGPIQSYSSGRVVVMQQALPVAPDNGDVVVILPYVWDAEAIAAIQRKR